MQHKFVDYGIISKFLLKGLLGLYLLCIMGCNANGPSNQNTLNQRIATAILEEQPSGNPFKVNTDYFVDGFDYPVGKPDAKNYYNAQVFGKNNHLGDDWNGTGGGNTDLGDPIFAAASGYVKFAEDVSGGWGNVIRINHFWEDGRTIESLYAHCDAIEVQAHSWIKRGDRIGTIGNADGAYYAHLHFEIRSDISLGIGGGYDWDTTGYLDPTIFIKANRPNK